MEVLKKRIKGNYHYIVSALAVVGIAFVAFNSTNSSLFNNLDQFILFAQEEIKLEQGIQISSGDLGSNDKIDIEKDAIINGNLFADTISIDKNTTINGNASFNKIKIHKEAKILGTQTKPVQLPIANLPEIPEFQIGTQDFKFEGENNALITGNYRDIVLEKNSRLILSGGVYNLRKLELKDGAVLIFNASATLNIQFKLKGQKHVSILPGQNNIKPDDLIINYLGIRAKQEKEIKEDDDNEIESEMDDKEKKELKDWKIGRPVVFGKNSFLNFKLLAPKASVHIGEDSTIRGQVLARMVRVEKRAIMSRELTTIKVSKPENMITDPGGGVYPINEILVSLTPTATISDAQKITSSIGGQIVSVIPPTLYKIEVRTKTTKELEDKLDALRNSNNPLITGIFRNFVMLENTGYPFNRSTYLSKVDQTLYNAPLYIFTSSKRIFMTVLILLSSILIIYFKKDLLTKTLKTIYNKLFYDKKHFKLFVVLSALSTIIPIYFTGLLAWLFFGWTLSSFREVITSLLSFPTIIQALGIPFETFVFDTGFVGYNQGVFDSAYSISFFSYSILGFVGNIIFFYSVLFLIRYVKKNLQHRVKSISVAFAIIFLLLFGTYVSIVRYFREVGPYIPSPINRIESFINRVNAQSAVKYDLQNLRNQNANLTRAYDKISIFDAWDKINNLQNLLLTPVVVGIVDTGVDANHQEFNNQKVNFGSSLASALVDSNAPKGHGTQVTGIIGANNVLGNGGILAANSPQMNGILSGALAEDKYKLEVRSASLVTGAARTLEDVYVVLKKVAASDAQIINMSFVLERCSDLSFTVRNFIVEKCAKTNQEWTDADAEFQGVFNSNPTKLFIAAAGNEDTNFVFATPAHWSILMPNVISVGASDLVDERANFPFPAAKSNFGVELNISAPGVGIYAPKPGGGYDVPFLDNGVIKGGFSGTSASAPMVTGVAGLIKAIRPELSPAQIKNILTKTENTDPVITEPDKPIGRRLNALKAVCDPLVLNCVPTPSVASPWPMLQKNAQRTGLADVSGPPFATSTQVTLKWQKDLGIASNFPPLVGSQAVYVSAGGGLRDLIAFDKTDGHQIWQSSIPAGAVNGAIGPDGTIYVCGLNTNQQSVLTAVNHIDGAIKWQFIVGSFRPCNPPAVNQSGIIYTTVPPPLNTQLAVVVAVNPDGTEKWRYEEGNVSTTPPSLSNDASQVYVGFFNDLKAFNSLTGQILWTKVVPQFPFLIIVDPTDRVLNQTLDGFITAFSKSGNFLWQSSIGASAIALYPQNKILLTGPSGFTFLNLADGGFISNGFWPNSFQLSNPFAIVDKDGLFYLPLAIFGNPTQIRLFAFNSGGNQRWTFDVPSTLNLAAIGGSALDSDGSIYLVAQKLLLKLGQ